MVRGEFSETWLARILGGIVMRPRTTPVVVVAPLQGDSGREISAVADGSHVVSGEAVLIGCGGLIDAG